MQVSAIIPVKGLQNIKSRLSSKLSLTQRHDLTFRMLRDVSSAIKASSLIDDCVVVSPDSQVLSLADRWGLRVLKEVDERGVNAAVSKASEYSIEHGATCTIVFPSDIPLLSSLDIDEIVKAGRFSNSVVITPSIRLDGTNTLLRNPPDLIQTYYDHDSFNSHLLEAERRKLRLKLLLSRRVMLDIDTPEDIKEFLSTKSDTSTYDYLHQLLGEQSI